MVLDWLLKVFVPRTSATEFFNDIRGAPNHCYTYQH